MALKKCNKCGMELSKSMLICPQCGYRFNKNSPKTVNQPHSSAVANMGQTPKKIIAPPLAGFWLRVGAFFIDFVIVAIVAVPALMVIPVFTSTIIWWLYSAIMESSKWQATLGKRVLSLKVTDVNGVRLSFGRSSGRFLGKFLSSAIFGIGFLMVLWTKNKQGLHDMLSSCLVYRRQ